MPHQEPKALRKRHGLQVEDGGPDGAAP
jgi:hypothetical protein